MKGTAQSPDYHPEGDVFAHTMLLLSHLDAPSETLAYGCLLHDVAKPVCFRQDAERVTFYGHTEKGAAMAEEILKRLKRSRAVWRTGGLSGAQSFAPCAGAADALEHAQAFFARRRYRGTASS